MLWWLSLYIFCAYFCWFSWHKHLEGLSLGKCSHLGKIFFLLFICFLIFIVIQLQLYAFSPHPSTPPQLNLPPSPTFTLPLDFVHVSFIVVPVIPSPRCPLPTPPWLWYIYTMEFYAAERKKELIPFATAWIELESIMLSEISQTVRDKYHMISPLTGT